MITRKYAGLSTGSSIGTAPGRRARLLASAMGAAMVSWSGAALAQAADAPVLGPVQVEGEAIDTYRVPQTQSPTQTAPLVDQPQTITVIPQAVIRERGARTLTEVLRNTPGISFDAGENGFSTSTNNFQLRGFDASGNIFIDGSRDSGSYTRDVFNIEAVEVVKGAAADNGRGGAGGYVNMVTKTPQLDDFAFADVTFGFDDYGSRAQKRVAGDVNYAHPGTTVALRLNALYEDSGIFGRDLAKSEVIGLAPSLAFGLGTPLRVIAAYEYVNRRDLPEWGVPGAFIEGSVRYEPSSADISRDAFYGLATDFDDVESQSALGRIEYDLNETFTISNQTRWSHVDRDARYTIPNGFDPVAGTVASQVHSYSRENTSLTNTTNLAAQFETGLLSHNLSAGLELSREESDAGRFGTTNPPATPAANPNPNRLAPGPLNPTEINSITVETIAIYAYDTIEIGEQFQITGGLRYEEYEVEIESRNAATGAPAGNLDGFTASESTLSGRIGAVFKPTPDSSLYASFGISAQPPGSYLSNPDISRTGDNAFPGFVPGARAVRSHHYEVGGKIDLFEDRLSASVALFHTEKRNVPWTGIDPADPNDTGGLKGYGKQIVQGVELSLAGQITPEWSVFGGLVVLESERKHDPALDILRRNSDPNDYRLLGQASNPFFTDTTNGDRLAFTPNVTGNLWTTYELPVGLTLGGGLQYVGSSYVGRPDDASRVIPNGIYGELPSYFLVHAMASYAVTPNVTLRANVDNVFDETHAVSLSWNANRATLGAPRTYRISASFNF